MTISRADVNNYIDEHLSGVPRIVPLEHRNTEKYIADYVDQQDSAIRADITDYIDSEIAASSNGTLQAAQNYSNEKDDEVKKYCEGYTDTAIASLSNSINSNISISSFNVFFIQTTPKIIQNSSLLTSQINYSNASFYSAATQSANSVKMVKSPTTNWANIFTVGRSIVLRGKGKITTSSNAGTGTWSININGVNYPSSAANLPNSVTDAFVEYEAYIKILSVTETLMTCQLIVNTKLISGATTLYRTIIQELTNISINQIDIDVLYQFSGTSNSLTMFENIASMNILSIS